jgi:hypothetical protein
VAVLFNAGDQLPFIPLFEVMGNALSVAPLQIAATELKMGVATAFIVTEVVAVTPAQPPLAATV